MSDKNKQIILVGGAILTILLIAVVGWLFRATIQEQIVEPTAGTVWWWWVFAKALFPQTEIWVLLVLLGIARLVWYASSHTKLYFPDAPAPGKPGRVGNWLDLLHLGRRAQRLFIKPLRFLAVDIMAEAENESRDVVFSQLHRQTLPLPKHLQAYLNKGSANTPARLKAVTDVENIIKSKTVDPEIDELITELENLMDKT